MPQLRNAPLSFVHHSAGSTLERLRGAQYLDSRRCQRRGVLRRARLLRHEPVHVPIAMAESSNANTLQSTMAVNPGTVNIAELLAACVDAAERACVTIKEVHQQRLRGEQGIEVSRKKEDDPRSALTIADQQAQDVVVGNLIREFPGIHIIAEEELKRASDDGSAIVVESDFDDRPLRRSLDNEVHLPDELCRVPLDEVCVCIDPLDGTLEFVEGRLKSVQCLIGIAVRGLAVAGAIGLPFHDGPVLYAIVGCGAYNVPPAARGDISTRRGDGSVLTSSQNPKHPVIRAAQRAIAAAELIPLGGAGNKVLAVGRGDADVALLNLITCLWDTCAPEALIRALGGTVTDLLGNRIRYSKDSRVENRYGVLVSMPSLRNMDARGRSHRDVCADLRLSGATNALVEHVGAVPCDGEVAQAMDIARDVDGELLTVGWLSSVIGRSVSSYSAPEASAVRYLMSDAVRISLKYDTGVSADAAPESLFYKRIVLRELEHVALKQKTAPEKVARDVKSYMVEANFLASDSCDAYIQSGARVARPYHVEMRPAKSTESPIESKFAMLLQDFSPRDGWLQVGALSGGQLRAALAALADMHAFFWQYTADPLYNDLAERVWDVGSNWAPERQARNHFDCIAPEWEKHKQSFARTFEDFDVTSAGAVTLESFGAQLEQRAREVARRLHSVGQDPKHPCRTIIHGDAKAANFFFRRCESDSGDTGTNGDVWDVGMIDFQWLGWGHPAVDISYVIAAATGIEELSMDGSKERLLIEFYYKSLTESLVRHQKASNLDSAREMLPFDELHEMVNEGIIDIARLVVAYHWARIKASPAVLEKRADMLGSNTYNKSAPHAAWLVSTTMGLLARNHQ